MSPPRSRRGNGEEPPRAGAEWDPLSQWSTAPRPREARRGEGSRTPRSTGGGETGPRDFEEPGWARPRAETPFEPFDPVDPSEPGPFGPRRGGPDPRRGTDNARPAGGRVPDLTLVLAVLEALRAAVPRELEAQFTALLREVLLALRALIDRYLERLDGGRRDTQVEDIPIE